VGLLQGILAVCLVLLAYVYAGYPVLVRLLAGVLRRRVAAAPHTPSVTVLIAAYNEARHIVETVRNKLAQDYPPDRLEVIVISDGSTDGTDELVRGLADPRVQLIRQEPRAGKTAGLNLAAPRAGGEILAFADANSLWAPDALARLVEPFADADVGYVTGRMAYRAPDGSLTGEGCSAYMRYENALRDWETACGSIVGVDGGIDAVRRELHVPMRADQLPDFVLPLTVRERGFRVVYEPRALLYEDALAAAGDEFRMRVRVSLRALHALRDKRTLLDPWRFGLFAWQLWSHKLLRYLAPLFQIGALVSNAVLAWGPWSFWTGLFAAQLLFYVLAWAGHRRRDGQSPRFVTLAYYLCLVNAAAGVALWRFLRGQRQVIWQPRT
jgi:cellulose synthase/poly-beta-1,6-N-acetylglucosamine synthase-like glycosyltransferase